MAVRLNAAKTNIQITLNTEELLNDVRKKSPGIIKKIMKSVRHLKNGF